MKPDERSDESLISVVFTTTDISSIKGFITWLPKLCRHVEYFFFHISFDCLFSLCRSFLFFSFLFFISFFISLFLSLCLFYVVWGGHLLYLVPNSHYDGNVNS